MAGWKTEQIYGTMPGMLNLAAGAGTDLARTADIVSDNMTAMGVPVEKASHFMDVYAYALTNSNVNLESLGETMKYAAPVAAAFGATLEDTTAMTMMMGNAGIKGSMAGTALRMGLLRLSGPPKKASKAMNELGISVSDATAMAMESEAELARLGVQYDKNAPPMEKMGSIITQLSTKMQGLSREEKLASIGAIFGANAASGWVNIIEQGPEVFNKYLQALKNCDGYSKEFAHIMNDDTKGALTILESSLDAVQNSIGDALLPAVRGAAEAFAPMATAASQWIAANPQIVQGAAMIAAAFAAIIVGAAGVSVAFAGFSFVAAQVGLARAAIMAFRVGMAGMAVESAGAAAALNALGLRLAALRGVGGMAAFGGWKSIFAGIIAQATAAKVAVVSFFSSLSISSIASGAVAAIKGIGSALAGAAKAAMGFAFSPIGIALMALAAAGYYVYTHWSQVAPVFSNLASTLGGALQGAITALTPAFESLSTSASRLAPAFSQIGQAVFSGLAVVLNFVVNVAATLITSFSNAVSAIMTLFGGLGNALSSALAGDFSKAGDYLWKALVSAGEKAVEAIKSLFSGLWDSFANMFNPLDIMSKAADVASGDAVSRHARTYTPPEEKAEVTQKVEHEVKVAMDTSQLASTFQNALQITQQKNPQADLSQLQQTITSSIQALRDKPDTNPDQIAAAISNAIQTTHQQNPEVDLSAMVEAARAAFQPAQENIQQTTQSISQAGEAFAQVPAMVQPLTDTFSQLPAAVQPATDGLTQIGTGAQTVNGELMTAQGNLSANNAALTASNSAISSNNSALSASNSALSAFNGALSSTNGGLSSLASSSSSAAGAISGLGSAASSAVSALQSAGANAAAAVSAAASAASAKPAANAKGGIYNKGAFLTWFAEKSPEAAIPLDKSARAVSLWQRVGQMLGILPKETGTNFDTPSTNETVSARQPKFDELGNIIGLHGLKDNVISKDDGIQVTNSKKAAQLAEWKKKYPSEKKIPPDKKNNPSKGIFGLLPQIFKSLPNVGNYNFNPLTTSNILPQNQIPKINPAVEENFSDAVKQSKSYQTLQAAQERLKNTTESSSIFGKSPSFENIFSGGLKLPDLMTQTMPSQIGQLESLKADSDGIFPQLINNLTSGGTSFDSASPIDLHFEINIQGNANAQDVQNGVEMSIPMIEDALERRLDEVAHEKQRRSFS